MNATPAVGADVLYILSHQDAEQINRRRADAAEFSRGVSAAVASGEYGRTGHVLHVGNHAGVGDVFPAKVVRAWGGTLNLKVQLDGNDDYWATSVLEGEQPGHWTHPLPQLLGTAEHGAPQVTDLVHYVSFGTPFRADGSQAYKSVCRAAMVTEVNDTDPVPEHGKPAVGLMVCNPTGQFFNQGVRYHDGAGEPGHPDCVSRAQHGNPHRYCACGWTEPAFQGGTWHYAGAGC